MAFITSAALISIVLVLISLNFVLRFRIPTISDRSGNLRTGRKRP